jgi:2'-5' RNA ligase superfamily
MTCRTALVVPIAEATPYYTGAPGVPGHVSILFPFAPLTDVNQDAVADLIGRFPAFDFELDRIETFDNGIRWLRPVPSTHFVDLTAAVEQRWPEYPPYEGAFDEVIPHVTITVLDVPLPIACRATEVLLLEEHEDGSWSTVRSFALYGVA